LSIPPPTDLSSIPLPPVACYNGSGGSIKSNESSVSSFHANVATTPVQVPAPYQGTPTTTILAPIYRWLHNVQRTPKINTNFDQSNSASVANAQQMPDASVFDNPTNAIPSFVIDNTQFKVNPDRYTVQTVATPVSGRPGSIATTDAGLSIDSDLLPCFSPSKSISIASSSPDDFASACLSALSPTSPGGPASSRMSGRSSVGIGLLRPITVLSSTTNSNNASRGTMLSESTTTEFVMAPRKPAGANSTLQHPRLSFLRRDPYVKSPTGLKSPDAVGRASVVSSVATGTERESIMTDASLGQYLD